MDKPVPVFTSAYSLRSILQIKPSTPNGPGSIYDIAKKYNLDKILLLEANFTSFLEANKVLGKEFQLVYGIEFICSQGEYEFKSPVFAKNTAGTKDLQKIYTKYSVDFDSKIPFEKLIENMTDNLDICIPFYNSFIHKNLLGAKIFADFGKYTPTVFLQSNDVMFDAALREGVEKYAKANNLNTVEVKSIFYENRKDFDAYLTYTAIQSRSTYEKPEQQCMSSTEFCMESLINE